MLPDDSEGILYLNSRGVARVRSPLRATTSGNPRLCSALKWIPEESFLISDRKGNIKKDSSGIARLMPLPWVTASVRPVGLTSRHPTAIQIKDSFGIV